MALPDPKPGLVIRYDYLWSAEASVGREQGKERPACLVAASDALVTPRFVVILPITHTLPTGNSIGIEIPHSVCRALGLDQERSWIIVSEHNVDEWPNGGLAPLPGKPAEFSYGFIPPGLFAQVKAKFLASVGQSRTTGVRR